MNRSYLIALIFNHHLNYLYVTDTGKLYENLSIEFQFGNYCWNNLQKKVPLK